VSSSDEESGDEERDRVERDEERDRDLSDRV